MKLWSKMSRSSRSSPRGSGRMQDQITATHPSAVLTKELTATFMVFDKDGNGKISKSELGEVLRSLGDNLTPSDLDDMMATLGASGEDGCIDLEQFIRFHTEMPSRRASSVGSSEEREDDPEVLALRSAFAVFDVDKNGFISAEELQRVMCSLGDKHTSLDECRRMINSVDRDGNQMVDFGEFQCLMSPGTSAVLSF